jgi:hypothetical protein
MKTKTAKEIFSRLYNLFRSKSGQDDRFEDHPGWDKPTGENNLTPWDRLEIAVEERGIELPGYIFVTLKKLLEDHTAKKFHPHFLLNATLLDEYQRTYSSTIRSIEIRWHDQRLIFDSGIKRVDTMPWFESATLEEKEKYVLLSENKQFTDLFVFYMAVQRGFDKLEEETKGNALFEYSLFPSVYESLIKSNKILEKLR